MVESQKLLIARFCCPSKIRTSYDLAGDALLLQKMYSAKGSFLGKLRFLLGKLRFLLGEPRVPFKVPSVSHLDRPVQIMAQLLKRRHYAGEVMGSWRPKKKRAY
jgi:hypothetical protein